MRRHVVTLVVFVVAVTAWCGAVAASSMRPQLGLDLQGGISVVLFPVEGSDTSTLGTAVDVIRNRVDALGVVEPQVSQQGNTIVIDLPGLEDRESALQVVGQTAQLRFRLVCNVAEIAPFDPDAPAEDPLSAFQPVPECVGDAAAPVAPPAEGTTDPAPSPDGTPPAEADPETAPAPEPEPEGDENAAGTRAISTAPVAAVRPAGDPPPTTTTTTPPPTTPGATTAPPTTEPGATTTTGPPVTEEPPAPIGAGIPTTPREENTEDAPVILPGEGDGDDVPRYALGPALLTGETIAGAEARFQDEWVVNVTFSGDEFVEQVAQPFVGQSVAIELDGVVQSAPVINPNITGRDVQISGGPFSEGEARDLALVLRYGSLPVQFDPEQQTVQSISPTLGRDQLSAGILAGLVGLALVALYMLAVYRLLGLVVWLGLGLTAMIFFPLVSWLSSTTGLTLTLAGVTGLVVSVGVTVDSYVVFFERLKDEVRSGKTVRSSIDVGFRRAFRTIVAADVVALIGATVLWLLAEGSVRGFAFFLGLSTVIDLVISYFFMYPLVAIIARRPSLVRMRGVGLASGLDVVGTAS